MNKTIKQRLTTQRETTPITIRMPNDVIASLKQIAPLKGFSGYQALLKSYVSDGLRNDESRYLFNSERRLIEALKKRGVSDDVLRQAIDDVHLVVWDSFFLSDDVMGDDFDRPKPIA